MRTQVRQSALGGAVVGVEGSFDVEDADRLQSMAAALENEGLVTLDFHGVRSASDAAVTRLASQLRAASRRVALVGLCEHHYKLLKYVGLVEALDGCGMD